MRKYFSIGANIPIKFWPKIRLLEQFVLFFEEFKSVNPITKMSQDEG